MSIPLLIDYLSKNHYNISMKNREDDMKIEFVTSDSHFRHANIIIYCDRPDNHDEIMFNGWNQKVAPENRVYHLGDVALGKDDDLQEMLRGLNGEKILIKGNHDRQKGRWYYEAGFSEFHKTPIVLIRRGVSVVLSHYPITDMDKLWTLRKPGTNKIVNIHGHLHNNEGDMYNPDGIHVNVSVELTDYKPVPLDEILDTILVS